MGVDYSARIIVGLPQSEFDSSALIEDDVIEVCPPYYDGNDDDCAIAGFTVESARDFTPSELEWDEGKIIDLKRQFKELTGRDAKVWLSPCGW